MYLRTSLSRLSLNSVVPHADDRFAAWVPVWPWAALAPNPGWRLSTWPARGTDHGPDVAAGSARRGGGGLIFR